MRTAPGAARLCGAGGAVAMARGAWPHTNGAATGHCPPAALPPLPTPSYSSSEVTLARGSAREPHSENLSLLCEAWGPWGGQGCWTLPFPRFPQGKPKPDRAKGRGH